ncbi:MAG: FAD-dependent oxidoreductase, partial [Planctomycetaceae bacterium]
LPPAAFSFSNADTADIGDVWWGTENQFAADPREALVSFISGPAAARWIANHDDARRQQYIRQMEAVQPGFAASVEDLRFIDWISDPWSRASYSFPAPGQITSQGPILHAGLGRLHFAGEHTCYPFIGYMEGALNSGVALARRMTAR